MKILSIINEKGGVGKSFIATQFAYFCRFKLGLKVLVVDLDQQGNSGDILTHSGLCVSSEVTSGEVLKDGRNIDATDFGFVAVRGDDYLLDLESMNDEAVVASNLNNALQNISEAFDLCIIDCAPTADVRQLAALSVATHYVVPLQVKAESISGVSKTLSRAEIVTNAVNTELEFVGLLLSMVKMQGIQKKNYEQILKTAGNLLIRRYNPKTRQEEDFCCIFERSEYTAAQQFNRPVFFSETGQIRQESTELNRIWITLAHKLALPVKKPIRIEKDPDTNKLIEVSPKTTN